MRFVGNLISFCRESFRNILIYGFVAAFMWPFAVKAAGNHDDKDKLDHIKHQIQSIRTDLGKTVRRQSRLEEYLEETQLSIQKLNQRLIMNTAFQKKQQKKLEQLNVEQQQYQDQLSAQKALLDKALVSAYQLGQADYIKVLLSQEKPEILDRLLMYHGYFSKDRESVIIQYQSQLKALEENKVHVHYVKQKLDELDEKLSEERAELQKALSRRHDILKKIHQDIDQQSSQLKSLLEDQEALEGVIANVLLHKTSPSFLSTETGNQEKGRFIWPIRGKMVGQFGAPVGHSSMRSNGVFIAVPKGSPVRAIASGQVVFSKWLRGYGQLSIIDHGEGLMSLYGHNSRLYKGEGARVEADEVIALSGHTAPYKQSGLYFEIRQHGAAQDPTQWCR